MWQWAIADCGLTKQIRLSTVLLDKLVVFQLVKKFPAYYGTRRVITLFTRARHVSQSSSRSIQSKLPPTYYNSWEYILLSSYHLSLGLPNGLFPSGFRTKTLHALSLFPLACCMSRPFYSSCFVYPNNVGPVMRIWNLPQVPVISSLLGPVMFLTSWGLLFNVCLKRAEILGNLLIGTVDRRRC
jgi:hypothetical protein